MTDELGPADTQNLDPFRDVPSDEQFVGELDHVETYPYALTPGEIAEHYDQRRARRERRARMETLRARVLLASLLLFVVLLALGHAATAFLVLLLSVVAAIELRRRGR